MQAGGRSATPQPIGGCNDQALETVVRAERSGAGGGSRTPRALRPYGFSYHFGFRRRLRRSWSGLSLHHAPDRPSLGAARLVSTPSRRSVRPGLARDCHLQGSPNLSSSASPVSRRALKFRLSPLRLPIPPRPRGRSVLMIGQSRWIRLKPQGNAAFSTDASRTPASRNWPMITGTLACSYAASIRSWRAARRRPT